MLIADLSQNIVSESEFELGTASISKPLGRFGQNVSLQRESVSKAAQP
jgi:hypothetical protein